MKSKYLISILLFLLLFDLILAQESREHFRVGLYSLQSPVGTKGFNTGHLMGIIDQIKSVQNDGINSAIPFRSWDRVKYPYWDFFGFVKNYISDLYTFTKSKTGEAGIQALTPALYSIFLSPPISQVPEDDSNNNRKLDKRLFRKFVREILLTEINLVVNGSSSDSSAVLILLNKYSRPFAGWYIDDEPFVRNHDIEVLEEMSYVVKSVEEDIFYSNELFNGLADSLLQYYHHQIFMAFDGDDLHGYKRSGRPEDGKTYNYNGMQYCFPKGQKYSILPQGTIDVLLIDFYHQDIDFWKKIITDVRNELKKHNRTELEIIPVIKSTFKKKYYDNYSGEYFEKLIRFLSKLDVDGLWIYQWNSKDDSVISAKDIWKDANIRLGDKLKRLKSLMR